MIRPFTCICMLLAAGAGLYLYQSKHQALMLDRDIARTLDAVDAARQRSGLLRAEYARLNDPSRLSDLATQLLPELKTTAPGQFTSIADLDKRLPPVGLPPEPAAAPLEPDPAAPDTAAPDTAGLVASVPAMPQALALAQPPAAMPKSEAAKVEAPRAEAQKTETQKAEPPRATVIAAAPPRPAPPRMEAAAPRNGAVVPAAVTGPVTAVAREPRPVVTQIMARVSPPQPAPQRLPSVTALTELPGRITPVGQIEPRPMVGSALGMARMMTAPAASPYAGSSYGYPR